MIFLVIKDCLITELKEISFETESSATLATHQFYCLLEFYSLRGPLVLLDTINLSILANLEGEFKKKKKNSTPMCHGNCLIKGYRIDD